MNMSMKPENETIDYYKLTDEQKNMLGRLIAMDNMAVVNHFFHPVEVPDTFYVRYGKRIIDTIIAAIALLVFAPVNFVLLIGTLFDVGNPIFFRQQRIGKDHKVFSLIKFRNMTNQTDANGVLLPAWDRVTRWGKFVRKTSLDELLNFWSILKGDMAIIGPRPMPLDYDGRFSQKHEMRHRVRPGLDCPMHNEDSGLDWEARFDNDVWYVQNISLKTDIKLFGGLIAETFWGEKRKIRGEGTGAVGGDFMGYFKNGHVMTSDIIPEEYIIQLLQIMPDAARALKNCEKLPLEIEKKAVLN